VCKKQIKQWHSLGLMFAGDRRGWRHDDDAVDPSQYDTKHLEYDRVAGDLLWLCPECGEVFS